MRWKPSLLVRCIGLVGIGALVGIGSFAPPKPGAERAYRDIASGQPKYFYVSGPPTNEPRPWPDFYAALEAKGIDVVGTGCMKDPANDDYNAVILSHYHLE